MRTVTCLVRAYLLAGLMIAVVLLLTAMAQARDYDAVCMDVAVPEDVMADEVFAVAITVENTGTEPWEGWPIRLRSVNAQNNQVWGADYILIAQGSVVQPGTRYVFRSNLRAPHDAGTASFQWQMCKDESRWFGDVTPVRSIKVQQRPASATAGAPPLNDLARFWEGEAPVWEGEAPAWEGEAPAEPQDVPGNTARREPRPPSTVPRITQGYWDRPSRERVLSFDDMEYLGSFKPPKTVGEARGAFSECGIALRRMADGSRRMFLNYTHPSQVLFEVEIPQLVKIQNGVHADLHTADVSQVWGPITLKVDADTNLSPNGGFIWMEETRTLIWTWYHGYQTGDAPPVLAATTLADSGAVTTAGPWRVISPAGLYKSYWGGVMKLPIEFAKQYTGGQTLALGFGGYYSVCAAASRGPALGAIAQPNPQQNSVSVTPLLHYPAESPAPRDGDYFNANCGFWQDQPADREHGLWTYDDYCRAGVWIETPANLVYIAFVRLGSGRLGYDFGAITHADTKEYWYAYDPQDLAAAAAGTKKPWQTAPASMTLVQYPLGRTVTGACFDTEQQVLYLCVNWAYPEGLEQYPIVHAYRVGNETMRWAIDREAK